MGFSVNFDDGESPWFVGKHSYAGQASLDAQVEDGRYIWNTFGTGGTFIIEKLKMNSTTDFLFDIEASADTRQADACVVMSFRAAANDQSYYQWQVCQDNTYAIYMLINGEASFAVEEEPLPSNTDLTQRARLSILGIGDTFQFFINDSYVGEWQDATLAKGELRYGVEVKPDDVGTFTFDNIVARGG